MLRVLSRKSLILSVTVLLGLLFLIFSTVVFGTAENVYADDEEGIINEEEIIDDGGCCPSGPGEIITLDDIPNTGAASSGDQNGLALKAMPKSIPLVAIVIGFVDTPYCYYDWGKHIFQDTWGVGEYYRQMSFGQFVFEPANEDSVFSFDGDTYDKENDGVIHVKLDQKHYDWKAWEDPETNWWMARAYIQAIKKASDYIDFPAYDTNGNGKIDKAELAVVFIVAGYDSSGEESDTYKTQRMRSHNWSISGILKNVSKNTLSVPMVPEGASKKVEVNHYSAVSEQIKAKDSDGNIRTVRGRLGSMTHELGHHLGLPDLYDQSEESDSLRHWRRFLVHRMSLMANGAWGRDLSGGYRASSLDPWCKIQLGWLTATTLSYTGVKTLTAANYSTLTKPTILKINIPGHDKEYYILENVRATGWDEGHQNIYNTNVKTGDGKGGLVLWHVDQQVLDAHRNTTIEYGRYIYYQINNTDHRPAVMPLYIERDASNKYNWVGDGGANHVFNGMPFFDLNMWQKYKNTLGADINLPTYQGKAETTTPANTRALSGVHVELLTNSGNTMKIRYITSDHTHSWTTTQEVTGEYCSTGKWAEIKTCSSCGQVRRTEKQGTAQHKYPLKYYPRIEPGCYSYGRDAHYECERCHEKYVDESGYYGTYTDEELKIPPQGHDYQIDDPYEPATYDSSGYAWMVCSRCGDGMWETFPMLDRTEKKAKDGTICGPDGAIEAADPYLQSYGSEKDPAGSQFHKIALRSPKQTKTSIQLKWTGPSNVDEYWLYGSKCGSGKKYKKIRTTPQRSVTVFDIDEVDLKKSTYYKFIVVGVDYDNNIVSTSKAIHVATKGSKKKSNNTSMYVSKKIVRKAARLKKGKKLALKAKAKTGKGCRVVKHIGLRYESTNSSIAKVSSKGTIKGVKKGTCYVYAYAQNGVYKKIKVRVK